MSYFLLPSPLNPQNPPASGFLGVAVGSFLRSLPAQLEASQQRFGTRPAVKSSRLEHVADPITAVLIVSLDVFHELNRMTCKRLRQV